MKDIIIKGLAAVGLIVVGKKALEAMQNPMKGSMQIMACPLPTQDSKLNSKNRQNAKDNFMYGPLNENPVSFWNKLAKKWEISVPVAKTRRCGNCTAFDISPRMKKCMDTTSNEVGYCWMHKFKCSAARSCRTWAPGGSITQDSVSYNWQNK